MTNSPTRFEPDVGFVTGAPEMYVNTAGSYIKFEDYEQLKQRLDAVVAENEKLIEGMRAVYTDGLLLTTATGGGDDIYLWDYIYDPKEQIEQWIAEAKTTSAVMAEQQAIGVEKLAARRRAAAKAAIDSNDHKTAMSLEGEAVRAEMFAAALRNGEAV